MNKILKPEGRWAYLKDTLYTATDDMTEQEMKADYEQWHKTNYMNLVSLLVQTQKKTGKEVTNISEWTMQQYVIYRRHQDSQYSVVYRDGLLDHLQ